MYLSGWHGDTMAMGVAFSVRPVVRGISFLKKLMKKRKAKYTFHYFLMSWISKKGRSSSKISTTCSNAMNECCTVWAIIVTWNRTWHQTGMPYGHTCTNVHTSFHNCLQCEQSSIVSRSQSLGNVGICHSSLNYTLAPGEETNKRRSTWIVYFLLS